MGFRLSILLLTVIPLFVATAHGQEWPRFRGGDSDGRAEAPGLFPAEGFELDTVWHHRLGSGYSGIVVADGAVVTMMSDGTDDVVIALDPSTGEERWRSVVELTYRGHDGSHDGPISTPLIAEGRVFALGAWGRFVALDLRTGGLRWERHVHRELGVEKPHYGFGSSPLFEHGLVLLQAGGDAGTVVAFDPDDGRTVWAAGTGNVEYQSASVDTYGPRRLVLAAGATEVYAIDPSDGTIVWEFSHEGRGHLGVGSMTPVPAGRGSYLLTHSGGGSKLIDLDRSADGPSVAVRWEDRSIRNTYNVPVYQDGHLFTYSARFLTAVDAQDGSTTWKSRAPGDGFLALADEHLVILTKRGRLSVGVARLDGFEAAAEIELFDDLAWTAPTIADGSIFVRSTGAIARVEPVPIGAERRVDGASDSAVGLMADLASELRNGGNASEIVDRFLAEHPDRPILDGELVHFVYRGEGEDLAIGGDLVGIRREEPMARLEGTDLFYYSARMPPGSRVNYVLLRDYEAIVDPANPRRTTSIFVSPDMEPSYRNDELEMSWVSTPPWAPPEFLAPLPDDASRGRLTEHRVDAAPSDGADDATARIVVWTPPGYDDSRGRYPVVYVDGTAALDRGTWSTALDRLVGDRVEEIIVAFVEWPRRPFDADVSFFPERVIPFVDSNYQSEPRAEARALVAMGFQGPRALGLAIERQDLFSRVGVQSAFVYSPDLGGVDDATEKTGRRDLLVYLDWATWDLRNPHENWDIAAANRRIFAWLRAAGFEVSGGEVGDGLGWSNWRQRTDDLLEALFPAP